MATLQETEHTYKIGVVMTCGGCKAAVERTLRNGKDDGVGISSYDVSLEKQEVVVTGTIPREDLLKRIEKTGKTISSIEQEAAQQVA